VLSGMAACSASVQPSPPDDRVCAGTVCLSPSVMTGQVRQLLDGQVVGYVALIGDRVAAAGAARKDTDPPRHPMGADVVANTASVGKMFTTVVVLKALAERGLGPDAAIGPYLPPDWARGPNTESITFRELLTHRSGFRLDNARIFTSDTAGREQIAVGVKAADKAAPEYNNINFSIIRTCFLASTEQPADHQTAGSSTASNTTCSTRSGCTARSAPRRSNRCSTTRLCPAPPAPDRYPRSGPRPARQVAGS